jgi:hypothetical protein
VRIRSITAVAALVFSALTLQSGMHTQAQSAADTRIRFAHFSVDAEGVDIYIDGNKKMQRVPYQAVTDYISVPAGKHTIEARGEGQPQTAPAVFEVAPDLGGGKSFTVAALGPVANIQAKVFEDDLTPPAAGKSKIRVIHAADGVGAVDVGVKDGDVLFPRLDAGAISTYLEVPAGQYALQVRATGTQESLFDKTVTVNASGIYTIAALGGGDKPLSVRGYIDIASSTPVATTTKAGDTTPSAGTEAATTVASTEPASSPTEPATAVTTEAEEATTVATKPKATPTTLAPLPVTTQPAPIGGGVVKTTLPPGSKPTGTAVPPKSGVGTGFGGFEGPSGAISIAAIGALMLTSVGTGIARRRSAKR